MSSTVNYADIVFRLFVWITIPAISANGIFGLWAICLLVEPEAIFVVHRFPPFPPAALRTNSTIALRIGCDRLDHAATTSVRLTSVVVDSSESAPDFAPPCRESAFFAGISAVFESCRV